MSSRRARKQSSGNGRRLTLALCVIARDEEHFVADCLDSARQFVDEIVVVDTGSTDRTREIARAHGARVEQFVWCDDFAAARNAAIEASTSDWILMLDADERLDPASGPLLRKVIATVAQDIHGVCPVIENRALSGASMSATMAVPRLFPRRRTIRFVGAIHEALANLADRSKTFLRTAAEIRVIHYGYDPEVYQQRDKDARNVELLQQGLTHDSDDARLVFFLLQQHVVGKRYAEAVSTFEHYARVGGSLPKSFLVQAAHYYLLSRCRLGDAAALERAEVEVDRLGALGAGALDTLSQHYAATGQLDRAIIYQERLLSANLPLDLEYSEGRGSWGSRLMLAELLNRRGEPGRSAAFLAQLEAEFAELPVREKFGVAVRAASATLDAADVAAAARWLDHVIECAPDTFEAHQQVLELLLNLYKRAPECHVASDLSDIDRALAVGDLQRMYDLAFSLPPSRMDALVRLHAVATRLRDKGEAEAALGLLNRALDGPRVEAVSWLLIKTLTQVGRYEDAQLAAEALRLRQDVARAA